MLAALCTTLVCQAQLPPVAPAARAPRPTGQRPATANPPPEDGRPPAQYSAETRWEIAGYNSEEIIFSVVITSHDTRIIRCSTEIKGFYFENGEKHSVRDRQVSTVFPDQLVQVGSWTGMDKESGATHTTQCRAL